MLRTMLVAAALARLPGCGGDDGDCEKPDGLYRISLHAESGNCGAVSDGIIRLPSMEMTGCSGSQRFTDSNMCVVESDLRCPLEGGGTMTLRGKITWQGSAGHASGTMFIQVDDRSGSCSGVYGATYTKL